MFVVNKDLQIAIECKFDNNMKLVCENLLEAKLS